MKLLGVGVIVAGFAVYLTFETANDRDRLRSLAGIGAIILVGSVFSKYPTKINWRPVILGVVTQILLGLFTIRWAVGRNIFE